jgi:hypothetical protein
MNDEDTSRASRMVTNANRLGYHDGRQAGRLEMLQQLLSAYRTCTPIQFEVFMRDMGDLAAKAEEHYLPGDSDG